MLAHFSGLFDGRGRRGPQGDLKVRREKTALALAEEFVELHGSRFPKAMSPFEADIVDTLDMAENSNPQLSRR
jgi:hypothetical protein